MTFSNRVRAALGHAGSAVMQLRIELDDLNVQHQKTGYLDRDYEKKIRDAMKALQEANNILQGNT